MLVFMQRNCFQLYNSILLELRGLKRVLHYLKRGELLCDESVFLENRRYDVRGERFDGFDNKELWLTIGHFAFRTLADNNCSEKRWTTGFQSCYFFTCHKEQRINRFVLSGSCDFSVYLCICLCVCGSMCACVYMSEYVGLCICVCMSVSVNMSDVSVCLSIRSCACLSPYASDYLCLCAFLCLSVCFFACVCLRL